MSAGSPTATDSGVLDGSELARARAHIAALEQLLEVHEEASIQQSAGLEQSIRERDDLLTRERRAREQLIESEQRLRLALDAGRMGTWEWDIAHQRVIWSAEEERLYGIAEGTFVGTIEDYQSRIHPDDRASSASTIQAALAQRARTYHILHRIVQPSGAVRWLDSHGRFIYATDGTPLRLVGVSTDVTERREIEAAREALSRQLEHERARLNEVLMQAPAAISVTEGPDHIIVMQNEMSRHLAGGRDLTGLRTRDIFPEIEAQGFLALQDNVYQTGVPFVGREMLVRLDRHRDGKPIDAYFNFIYHPLRDADGVVTGILSHAVEVTEQVTARHVVEEKVRELARLTHDLERSNHELDQFAYVASHDLKAPLRGIANLAQWIEEDLGDRVTGESAQHMQLLKGRVHRMEALIDGILRYSRAGRVREKPESVAVGQLLKETLELLAPPLGASITIQPDMPVLVTERVPLQQVFLNLISNAFKYANRADPSVEITARRDGDFVDFAVVDNGPGIPPQFRERVWQIFQTLEARDKVEGTGIGLSVVRKLVEVRDGRAWIDSAPGGGSAFHFTWPTTPRNSE